MDLHEIIRSLHEFKKRKKWAAIKFIYMLCKALHNGSIYLGAIAMGSDSILLNNMIPVLELLTDSATYWYMPILIIFLPAKNRTFFIANLPGIEGRCLSKTNLPIIIWGHGNIFIINTMLICFNALLMDLIFDR